jgi:trimeric autotransporter adhesin
MMFISTRRLPAFAGIHPRANTPGVVQRIIIVLVFLFFVSEFVMAQAPNNVCSTAIALPVNAECVNTAGDLYNANATSPTASCGGNRRDVWYSFTVPANSTFATITVRSTSNPSGITNNNTFIELFNTNNCTINNTSVSCGNISSARTFSNLTPGGTYNFRIYTTGNPTVNPGQWNFNVCVTSNDNCSSATEVVPGTTKDGVLFGASASPGMPAATTGDPDDDVWYRFTAVANHATITLSNIGSNLYAAGAMMQIFSGTCGTLAPVTTARGITTLTGLSVGTTYYVRVYSAGTGQAGYNLAGGSFRISVTPSAPVVVSSGRMNEMYHQTVLSAVNTLDNPWEITYGPDNKLWITESKGYRLYRMDPETGARDTVLDLSLGSTFLPAADQPFNMQFNIGTNNPQGGFAGLALHPRLLHPVSPQNFVYVSYVHSFQSNTDPNGIFYTNRVVRFTYNTGTNKLESPISLCDTIPGSNDHNSQRMIIAPVGGSHYLFYAAGDVGAGQFQNRLRPNKSQLANSYEGKILRFNLEEDGDSDSSDRWIPNDNPFNGSPGPQSAVWVTGIRNNQGFAYDSVLNILYGSSHGPYSDDEINIIQPGKNYGHPIIIGYAADSNYNGSTAGAAFTVDNGNSTCPPITDETGAALALGITYKDPLFSAYNAPRDTVNKIWTTNPGNGGWPSEGWSGLDLYTHTLVPGWKQSLVAASLKWGRLVRLKLSTSGDSVVATGGKDSISYFGSTNRFRDLALAPGGKDLYVIMDRSATTSGPSAANPVIPACGGCVQKYTFLGYADASGKSSISPAIDVAAGINNTCAPGTTVTINNVNSNFWVPITGPDGNIMAEIYANGQTLGEVTSSFYHHVGAIRAKGGARYLDRNIRITPQFAPVSDVKVRFYITKSELDLLDSNAMSQISSINDLRIHMNNDPCQANISGVTTLVDPTVAEAHNANGYILQTETTQLSSAFYFGAANLTLPVNLILFTGIYQQGASQLKWETNNEINTDFFIVERSNGDGVFETIGKVYAKGGSGLRSIYTLADPKAASLGVPFVYYRLRIVDRDQAYSYSNIVKVNIPGSFITMVNLFPNPTRTSATLAITSGREQQVNWQLIDYVGRVVRTSDVQLRAGENRINIDLREVPAGGYIIRLKGQYINTTLKLQKQY